MGFLDQHGNDLNAPQLQAVSSTEGPLLVLAGAGSGKTRVLTYRIAHLVQDKGVPLSAILAMTFSNKAAREMQERVRDLMNFEYALPWVSTFHSVGARILRVYGAAVGVKPEFVIYDEGEQSTMIKDCMGTLGIDDRHYSVDAVHTKIGDWKNRGMRAKEAGSYTASGLEEVAHRVYELYEKEMNKAQALDFDDLLLKTYWLFKEQASVREYFQKQWRYVLIDEFQDTNELQYKLLLEFVNPETHNVCVVGDDDQSIYGWRGAKIDNILNFDKVFKTCQVVKLEQNYRSTETILKAADQVIVKNSLRHEKTLWTQKGKGERICYAALEDDRGEASYVIKEIQKFIRGGGSPEEVAVLYRVNSLSRGFEEECLRQRLPYRIIGGFRFYERREVKDVLSYLKLLINPADIMSFRRSVNTPARGIGKTTIEKIETLARESGQNVVHWLMATDVFPGVGRGKEGLKRYAEILRKGIDALDANESFVDLMIGVMEASDYVNSLKSEKTPDADERVDNLQELMSAIQEFEEGWAPREELPSDRTSLVQKVMDFLERVSLIADVDQLDSNRTGTRGLDQPQVTFMSMHAAKGLEFDLCFMCGLEEGLFPSSRSFDDEQRLEEERRLCYVGITRAKQKLFMTRALRRRTFGSINMNLESRFLKDISKDLFDVTVDQSQREAESGASWSYGWTQTRKAAASRSSETESFDYDFDQRVPDDEFSFAKGQRVSHPSFGEGVVQRVEMLGADECLSILFHRLGKKKVLAKFVKKVGE